MMTFLFLMTLFINNACFSLDTIPAGGLSVTHLSEIIIQGNKKKVIIRDDTTFFNLSRFKDGSEKKVEDILLKLPGISIHPDNGKISYNGKMIAAVKIDGFDLLGSNYVVGTKNIPADIIEEIQAIENDPDNPLMKNIQSDGKLVLNLKTKKNTGRLNADMSMGAGERGDDIIVKDVQLNLLGLSGRRKFFTAGNLNNRGMLNGSASFFNQSSQTDTDPYVFCRSASLTDPLFISLPLDLHRYFINNTHLLNGNLLFQPRGDHQSIRLHLSLSRDQLSSGNDQFKRYASEGIPIETSDRLAIRGEPVQLEADVEWKQPVGKKLWIQYRSLLQYQHKTTRLHQVMNEALTGVSRIASTNIFHCHELDLTYKPGQGRIFRSVFTVGNHQTDENINSEERDPFSQATTSYHQNIHTRRSTIRYRGVYTVKKGDKNFEVEAGVHYTGEPLHTLLQSLYPDSIATSLKMNVQDQQHTLYYNNLSFTFRNRRWVFVPKFSTNYHLFSFFNSEGKELCRSFFRPEASISVTQKINQATKWIHTFSLTNQSLSLQPTFSQPVMISPRVILRNDVFPDLQKTVVFQSILIYHNLFRQQIAQIDFQYLYQDKTTISSMGIDERFIQMRMAGFAAPLHIKRINSRFESFLRQLHASIISGINFSRSNYYNQLNEKAVRNNILQQISFMLECKTAFKLPVNAGYKFFVSKATIASEANRIPGNFLHSQSLNIYWQHKKKLYAQFTADWMSMQRDGQRSVLFLDFLLRYKPPQKKYALAVVGKNLAGHRYFSQWQVNDVVSTELRAQLLPTYLLLQFDYRW